MTEIPGEFIRSITAEFLEFMRSTGLDICVNGSGYQKSDSSEYGLA